MTTEPRYRRVQLSSLADDLDQLLGTNAPPDLTEHEDLEALPDDELLDNQRYCKYCGRVFVIENRTQLAKIYCSSPCAVAAASKRQREKFRVLTQDSPAIPAETQTASKAEEEGSMSITSSERVVIKRIGHSGRAAKSNPHGFRMQVVLPKDIADLVPDGTEFVVELSEQGLLFKPASMVAEARKAAAPAWTRNGAH